MVLPYLHHTIHEDKDCFSVLTCLAPNSCLMSICGVNESKTFLRNRDYGTQFSEFPQNRVRQRGYKEIGFGSL